MQETDYQATNAFTECKFTCTSGKCLYLGSLVCNQQNDCGDNSDEENCLLVTEHPPPGIFNSELEFAQIIIIVVVVTVMVVVIVCLLNHYKVSTRSFINRPNQSRRQEDGLQPVSVGLSLLVLPRPLSRAPEVRLGAHKGHKAGHPLESARCGPSVSKTLSKVPILQEKPVHHERKAQ